MLKVGLTQEELNGQPRDLTKNTGLTITDLGTVEIPPVLVEIATLMQSLKDQRSLSKQLELEITHA